MSIDEENGVVGGVAIMVIIVGFLASWAYDKTSGSETLETHTIVSTATDARFSGGKIKHKYQVEILVTKDANGELHKIDCPLKFWVEAKEDQKILVKHWNGPLFQSFKLITPTPETK